MTTGTSSSRYRKGLAVWPPGHELTSRGCLPVKLGSSDCKNETLVSLLEHTERNPIGGYYPLGLFQNLHGGVHIESRSLAGSARVPVGCLTPGRIVAIRMPQALPGGLAEKVTEGTALSKPRPALSMSLSRLCLVLALVASPLAVQAQINDETLSAHDQAEAEYKRLVSFLGPTLEEKKASAFAKEEARWYESMVAECEKEANAGLGPSAEEMSGSSWWSNLNYACRLRKYSAQIKVLRRVRAFGPYTEKKIEAYSAIYRLVRFENGRMVQDRPEFWLIAFTPDTQQRWLMIDGANGPIGRRGSSSGKLNLTGEQWSFCSLGKQKGICEQTEYSWLFFKKSETMPNLVSVFDRLTKIRLEFGSWRGDFYRAVESNNRSQVIAYLSEPFLVNGRVFNKRGDLAQEYDQVFSRALRYVLTVFAPGELLFEPIFSEHPALSVVIDENDIHYTLSFEQTDSGFLLKSVGYAPIEPSTSATP